MRFDRAYCNQAVCAPSRNSLLTGRRPQSLGIYDLGTNFRLAVPDAIRLPQFFIADEAVRRLREVKERPGSMWCKHTNYEEATRIPLLVVAPGVTRPGTYAAVLVETVDLYPTLLELAGLPAPEVPQGLDGRSLVPVLRDPSSPFREAALQVYPRTPGGRKLIGRSVRTARYPLIEWKVPGAAPETADLELYDYEGDPAETRNLAGEQPEVVARLRRYLSEGPEARPQIAPAAEVRRGPE
jgi:arylsulfatase A-like enzyme